MGEKAVLRARIDMRDQTIANQGEVICGLETEVAEYEEIVRKLRDEKTKLQEWISEWESGVRKSFAHRDLEREVERLKADNTSLKEVTQFQQRTAGLGYLVGLRGARESIDRLIDAAEEAEEAGRVSDE